VRETDTVVRAKSGQIIVIGGLMANSTEKQRFGAPVLSDIPGVGALFRSTREVERRTELVILLKPLVMEDDSDWSGLVADPLRRVREMERRGPGG
jgi:MSHA biogenesis protein MshL